MPLYEYQCECGKTKEVILPVRECGARQVCGCGRDMTLKVSLPRPPVMVPTGAGMALDSLNQPGSGLPAKNKNNAWIQQKVAEGLERKPRAVW